ncbi:MAG TPA: protein-L-isoaspartate O-methyltransferase [Pseudolabrys sp.]|nr:protein-L-isoaspartate O-methyltransferase [Pseudolabrys sp.]
MTDFAAARRMMVDNQVRTFDVTDLRIIGAMQELPRERFVAPDQAGLAYLDMDIPVGKGTPPRHLLKPMTLARLVQAAEPRESDHVLDVGCATGYSAALWSRLGASVVALEEDAALAKQAGEALTAVKARNVTVVTGPLRAGWPAQAPYDVILLNGATDVIPQALCEQLKDGGRLLCVLGRTPGKAMLYRRNGDVSGRTIFDAAASLLPGFAKIPAFAF